MYAEFTTGTFSFSFGKSWLVLSTLFQVTFTEEELPKGSGDFILGYYSNNMSTIVGVTEPFQVITAIMIQLYVGHWCLLHHNMVTSHLVIILLSFPLLLFNVPLFFFSSVILYLFSLFLAHLQILLPTSGLDTSASDSSDFSSEDDSTVVLMKTRSRSPSPVKGKHPRSYSRGHSRSRSGSPAEAKVKGLNLCEGSLACTVAENNSTHGPAEGSTSHGSATGEKPSAGDSGL